MNIGEFAIRFILGLALGTAGFVALALIVYGGLSGAEFILSPDPTTLAIWTDYALLWIGGAAFFILITLYVWPILFNITHDDNLDDDTIKFGHWSIGAMLSSSVLFFTMSTVGWAGLNNDILHHTTSNVEIFYFVLDLALKGMFLDILEHLKLSVTSAKMNYDFMGYVWYAFAFRIYVSVAILRLAIKFVRNYFI